MNELIKLIKNNLAFTLFLIAFTILNVFLVISCIKNNNNISNFFRIHIVGATDSIEDQKIKLEVAENVQKYITSISQDLEDTSKGNVKHTVVQHIDQILSIANNTIKENNKNYTVTANIGNIYYDEKTYNYAKMDNGIYDSLQIVLDYGMGQNWWSLIYPYSYECSVSTDLETTYTNNISTEDILVSNDTQISFGLFELILNMFRK